MGKELKVYDHQDVIAATTLSADGAPLDGPEIVEGRPIAALPGHEVFRPKLTTVTGFESGSQVTK